MNGILPTTTNSEKSLPFSQFLLSTLIWNTVLPSWLNFLLHIFSQLQIIALLFNFAFEHFNPETLNSVGSIIKNLSIYVSFRCNFDFSGSGTLTNLAFGIIGGYVIVIMLMTIGLILLYFLSSNKQNSLSKFWVGVSQFNYNFCFLFVHYFALSLINYATNEDLAPNGFYSSQALLIAIATFLIFTVTINGLISSKFAYHPIKDGNILASRTSNLQFCSFIFKFTEVLLTSLITYENERKWFRAVFCVVFLGFRLVKYMRDIPFYKSSIYRLFLIMAFIQQAQATLNLFWLLVDSSRKIPSIMVVYSHLIFGIIAVKLSEGYVNRIIWDHLDNKGKPYKTESEFFKGLFTMEKVLKAGSSKHQLPSRLRHNEFEIVFTQMISKHAKFCVDPECGCKIILIRTTLEHGQLLESLKKFDMERFHFDYMREFYLESIKSIKRNNFIKLQLVNFLIDTDENTLPSAVYLLNTINSEFLSLQAKVIKNKLKNRIENKMKTAFMVENSSFNVKQIVDYYTLKQNLRLQISSNTKIFTEFWRTYRAPNPLMNKMLELNVLINKDAEKVDLTWKELEKNYSKMCYKDYIIYGIYMQLIRNAPFTAENLLARYFSLLSLRLNLQGQAGRNAEAFLAEENILLYVSLNQNNFANIIFVSQNVEKLGYSMNDLMNKSVGLLMSPFFAKKHHRFLLNEVTQNTRTKIMNKELNVFVRARNGFISSAKLLIMPFPYLDNGFYCLAILKQIQSTDDYLFILPDGKIEAVSEELGNRLNLDPNNIGLYFINEICQESSKIFRYINELQATENAKEEHSQKNSTQFALMSTKNFEAVTDTDLINPLSSPGSPGAFSDPRNPLLSGNSKASKVFGSRGARTSLNMETLDEVQDKFEDFQTKGVKLRFERYTNKKGLKNLNSNITLDITISAVNFNRESVYILKAQNFQEEKGERSFLFQNTKNRTIEKILVTSETGEVTMDLSLPIENITHDLPPSKINHRTMTRDFNKHFVSLQTEIPTPTGIKPNIQTSLVHQTSISQSFSNITQGRKLDLIGVHLKENGKGFLKDQRVHLIQTLNPQLELETTSTRTETKGMLTLARTERNIYYAGGVTSYKMVKCSVLGFVLMSVVLFIYYQIQGNRNFSLLVSNVNVLALSITRLFQSVELKRRATVIKLIESGFVERDRNKIPDFDALLISDFLTVAGNISEQNNQLRNSVYQFNEKQQEIFYEPIQISQSDNLTLNYQNGFDLCSQLVSAAMRLYSALPKVPTEDDPDLTFLFENTINSFVNHSEKLFDLLAEEDRRIVQQMTNLLLYLLAALIFAGVIAILVLIKSEVTFIKKKMMFFDHFLRINENDVDQVISKATKFCELLDDKNTCEEGIMEKMQEVEHVKVEKKQEAKNKPLNHSHIRKKNGNFKYINKNSWLGVIFLMIFIFSFWLTYSILCIFFIQREDSMSKLKSYIVDTNLYLTRFSEGITMLYLYIGEGDTDNNITIRNIPLTVEWENNFDILLNSNTFFVDLMKTDWGNYTETVRILASGDLCTLQSSYVEDCYIDGKGTTTQGLIALNNYFVSAVNGLRIAYDNTGKTFDDKTEIYSDPLYSALERLYFGPIITCYQLLADIAEDVFLRDVESFKKSVLVLNVVAMAFFIFLGRIYWITGIRRMQREKIYFRKILRVIPLSIILQNKYLQNYMLKRSKDG